MTLQAQIKWVTNLADFKRAVEEGTGTIVAHTAKVEKLTQSLGGSGLLGAANNYVAAIERMGGVEKLTAAEKERINGLVVKALEKYQALGREAPAALQRLATATKPVEVNTTLAQKATDFFNTSMTRLAASFAIGGLIESAVTAVISWGRAALASAGAMVDVSDKTGLSIRTVQEFAFVAKQTGTSMEAFSNAAFVLGTKLAGGGSSVVNAVDALGLSYRTLQSLSPDEQFKAVVRALEAMKDPQARNQLAVELFGRSAGEILPAIASGYSEIAGQARIASDEQVRALDRQQDAWDRFKSNIGTSFVQAIGGVWLGIEKLTGTVQELPKVVKPAGESFLSYAFSLEKARTEVANLTEWQKAEITTALKLGKTADEISERLGVSKVAIRLVTEETQKHEAAVRKTTAAVQKQVEISAEERRILELVEIARRNQAASLKFEEAAYRQTQAAAENYIQTLPTAIFQTTSYAGAVAQVSAEAATYQGNMAGVVIKTDEASKTWERTFNALGDVSTILNNIPGQFAEIASIAARTGQAIMKNLADGNIWGAIVAGATGVLSVFTKLFGSAGRDEVKKFAQTFADATDQGGFDNLHAKLLTLGAAGEQLWIKLTQGVGRNNPEQAKKVIEEINAALAGQDAWMQRLPGLIEKYGLSWEQAGQKANQARLDEIARGLIQDFADLSKAGFDVTLITEKMSGAINDYIRQAVATGTEVPAAMRPLIEKMIEMGTLTDANGNAITSLEDSGITFAQTMTEGFKSIVDAIKELTKALGGVRDGINTIPDEKEIVFIARRTGDWPTEDETGAERQERFHRGTPKVLPFVVAHTGLAPDEVPAILQTGEAVLNRRAAAAVGAPAIAAMNRGDRRPDQQSAVASAIRDLRADLQQQRNEMTANRRFMEVIVPAAIEAAVRKGAA